jgi:hypothetical protein
MRETALGLLVPETTDSPNGPAQIGGNAERADALLQKGGVAGSTYQAAGVTRTSTVLGAFSTPILVTLPKVKANQLIEVRAFGTLKESLESTGTGAAGKIAVKVGAIGSEENLYLLNAGVNLPANTALNFATGGPVAPFAKIAAGISRGAFSFAALSPLLFVVEAEASSVAVELQGAGHSTGTITAEKVWLQARVVG